MGETSPSPCLVFKAVSKTLQSETRPVSLPYQRKTTEREKAAGMTTSYRDTSMAQSLSSPFRDIFLPKKSCLAENPAWLRSAGELPGDQVLAPICLFFWWGKMAHQAKNCYACLIGFPLAQLSREGMLDETCQRGSTSHPEADCFPSQVEHASSAWKKKKKQKGKKKKKPVRYLPAANK